MQPSPLVACQQRQGRRCLRVCLHQHLVLLWWEVLMAAGDAQPWVKLWSLRLQCSISFYSSHIGWASDPCLHEPQV